MTSPPARNILFVCTGNTCRSPMAEAIAASLLQRLANTGGRRVNVFSAGVAALEGDSITPEAEQSLRGLGVEPRHHRAVGLTKEMALGADLILCMTTSHADRVRALAPDAAARIHTLDPSGADVPDPIGRPQSEYDATARRLRELIEARLKEIVG